MASAMTLYNAQLSPFAARVRIQIYAKGLDVAIVEPPRPLDSDAYLAINPIGKIPALDIGGRVLPESQIIAEYLEEVAPEPALLPRDPLERAHVRLLCRVADLYLMAPLSRLFRQIQLHGRDEAVVKEAVNEMEKGLRYAELFLVGGGRYAHGDHLTLADAALVTTLVLVKRILPMFGHARSLENVPKLLHYDERVREDPHVDRVLKEMEEAMAATPLAG